MHAFGPCESVATAEGIPRLPLDPIHLVEANLEASDQREAADAIFAVEAEDLKKGCQTRG